MNLAPETRDRIEDILRNHRIVLFMKGTRNAPRCGFSAGTAGILNGLVDDYASVDVLADPEIREGIKAYGNWPTIPQLYVDGELIGGADIVAGMANSGELHELLGLPKPDRTPPSITVSDAAADAMRAGLADADGMALHLSIDARFQAQFFLRETDGTEIRAESNGIAILMDVATAQRARGIAIDWVDTVQGSGLSITNPNAPPTVQSLDVQGLKARIAAGDITVVDVRPAPDRQYAPFAGAEILDEDSIARLSALPKDRPLAFLCHHGNSSRGAAEHFRGLGFRQVFNVEGGIDAWSRQIDESVPRY
ncbi:Grx4 family monothiol glutaredoxin [Tahibacter soli]|jgi:monothiol glutaredoxin|uniref:Grx4 family monothiol glutaredoxin n=1 Tax=Tahibacter soli TaxID=2983605 RepID=A0A9X3YN61_9GAMM|nr:Grx4 family monothiol glutaredoxin [Tahibacter soli]MDC8013823.1 Grx4 family monothiol glutaredoxin [Tahibacter soli]